MTLKKKFKLLVKDLLTNEKYSFIFIYPLILFFGFVKGFQYLIFKQKATFNHKFIDKFNDNDLKIDLGKTHINFKEKSEEILRLQEELKTKVSEGLYPLQQKCYPQSAFAKLLIQ